MDIHQIQPLLRAKGVHVTDRDPVFTLLALNDAVLEGMTKANPNALTGNSSNALNIPKMQSILLKNGIRVGNDDPIFALLALNEIVLEDLTKKHMQRLRRNAKRLPHFLASIAPLQTVCACFAGFCAGIVCAHSVWIGGGIGIALSFAGAFLFAKGNRRNEPGMSADSSPITSTPAAKNEVRWTQDEFQCASKGVNLSDRTLAACRSVLVDGISFEVAAAAIGVHPLQFTRGLRILDERKRLAFRSDSFLTG